MFKKLNKFEEEKFIVLRGPLESGRQSPTSLAGTLLVSIFLYALFIFMSVLFILDGWGSIVADTLFITYIVLFSVLSILSVIYSIPRVYWKSQKIQYFLSIIVSQVIIYFMYSVGLFMLADDVLWSPNANNYDVSAKTFTIYVCSTIILGIIIVIIASIRLYHLLKKGAFERRTFRDDIRGELERNPFASIILPLLMIGVIIAILTGVSLNKIFHIGDVELLFGVPIGITLFYVILFILPEQLVILYCKKRFCSFNYDKNNTLYPIGSGDRYRKK